jgi:hypothetical protein
LNTAHDASMNKTRRPCCFVTESSRITGPE